MWYENSDNVKYTVTKCLSASEESLLEAQLQAGGAKICYTQHRSPPSTISSATSSSASVASCGGSTAALINKQNKNKKHQFKVNIHKHKIYNKGTKMNNTTRKELNLLITNPTILVGLDSAEGKDKQHDQSTTVTIPYSEMERDDDRRLSFNGKPQYELENIDEKTSHSINDTVNRTGTYDPNTTQSPGVSLKSVFPQVLAAISVSLCSMVVGFSSGYTSPATYSMRQENSTIQINEHQASWIGSIMPLCALIGGIIGGPLIDTIGRKTTILSTAIPFILSFLLIALANGVPMVLTGRAISGLCVGISSLALPVYLGETVQPEVRGALGLLPTTLGNAGILICFVAGKYLDWSSLALLGAVIPVPFLVCMFLIPETPRWFVEKNKLKKARKSLQWLRGKRTDVTNEFSEIEKSNQDVEKNNEFLLTEFFSKKYRRPLLIAIGLMFFQQMSGINALIFYTVSIFKDAGSTIDENLSTIILGVVNMFSTFVATMLIDRLGRKILLYTSSVLMASTLAILGGFFYFKNVLGASTADYGWVPLMSFVIFVIGFSIGFGPIPWLMLGEILPVKIRGSAAALVTAFNWSCTFIVTKTFTDLKVVIGQHGAFWVFASICFAGLGFTIMSVPETQGKSLEDIERNLTGVGEKVPVRAVRRMSSIANLKPTPMSF